MENDANPAAPIGANTKRVTRSGWNMNQIQLHGRSDQNYVHKVSPLLMKSYTEIGAIDHVWESRYRIHSRLHHNLPTIYSESATEATNFVRSLSPYAHSFFQRSLFNVGVSALEYNKQGTYLASMTRSGCLTVHRSESLYNRSSESDRGVRHYSVFPVTLFSTISNAVRWNPSNQVEIACTSMSSKEVCIFDVEYHSPRPIQVLTRSPAPSIHVSQGLSDMAFFNDGKRVLASDDTSGLISIWDRRVSHLPQTRLTTNITTYLNSIQLLGDQCVYGAGKTGFIYIWDLRGGRSSASFQSDQAHHSPLTSIKLVSMLHEIEYLKAQSNFTHKGIESLNINPSCSYQLGFHLHDGWSGVLDMHNFRVSHIHCPPPPPWLDRNAAVFKSPPGKPSWLPKHSIYVAASTYSNGLHLVDFYPHSSSPCHVDYDDSKSMAKTTLERKQSVFVPLSKRVTACAVHPLNDTIVAGTMESSLLMISQ